MNARVPLLLALSFSLSAGKVFGVDYPVQPVPFTAVRITGGFWQVKQEINRTVTVPFALQQGEATVAGTPVRLVQSTDYPWSGRVRLSVSPERPKTFTIRVRIPEWAQGRPLPSDLYAYDNPQPDLLGGVTVLKIGGSDRPITAIPYYAWNNRGLAPMAVWLKRR
jgi:hypothetical protein